MKPKRQLYCMIYNEVLWNFKQDMILNSILLRKNKREIEKKIQEVTWYDWSRIAGDNLINHVLYRHFQEWGDGGTEKAGEEGFINLYRSSWEKTGWDHQIFVSWHSEVRMRVTHTEQDKIAKLFQPNLLQLPQEVFLYSVSHLRKKVH